MRLHVLLLTCLLFGCAHASDNAPRATFDPDQTHYAPGLGEPNPEAKVDPLIERQKGRTCVGPCPDVAATPCGGKCGPGEFCDQAGGIDRCVKDVLPASAPGK